MDNGAAPPICVTVSAVREGCQRRLLPVMGDVNKRWLLGDVRGVSSQTNIDVVTRCEA